MIWKTFELLIYLVMLHWPIKRAFKWKKIKVIKIIKNATIEPTHICPLCMWDLDEGGFYIWDRSRRRLTCPKCGSDFNAGDVVFDHELIRYDYAGNNPLFIAADVFRSMRTLSEKEFFEQMASYDVSEEKEAIS